MPAGRAVAPWVPVRIHVIAGSDTGAVDAAVAALAAGDPVRRIDTADAGVAWERALGMPPLLDPRVVVRGEDGSAVPVAVLRRLCAADPTPGVVALLTGAPPHARARAPVTSAGGTWQVFTTPTTPAGHRDRVRAALRDTGLQVDPDLFEAFVDLCGSAPELLGPVCRSAALLAGAGADMSWAVVSASAVAPARAVDAGARRGDLPAALAAAGAAAPDAVSAYVLSRLRALSVAAADPSAPCAAAVARLLVDVRCSPAQLRQLLTLAALSSAQARRWSAPALGAALAVWLYTCAFTAQVPTTLPGWVFQAPAHQR